MKTNYERIKDMSLDEMSKFLGNDFIRVADDYICKKCKKEHNGHCPMNDEGCMYDFDNAATIRLWLEGEVASDD